MDIVRLDQDITLAINSLHSQFTDLVWQTFSDRYVWFAMYLIVVAFLIWKAGWKKGLVYIASMALCLLACDQFSNLIKEYVCRLRPCHDPYMLERGLRVLEDAGGQYGFFSSHAANAFGFAVCAAQAAEAALKPRHKWFVWLISIWAALVSVSRIFVGKHYLGDVLAGTLAGLVIGCVCASLGSYVCSRLKDRSTDR